MTFFNNIDTPCGVMTSHCAKSRTDYNCCFCGTDTSNFSRKDWDTQCDVAVSQNIQLSHNYVVDHIQGMAVREQDYVQVIYYRCTNCGDRQVERDDQR